MKDVLIETDEYLRMRRSSRSMLNRQGIYSNPAWTDENILSAIVSRLEIPDEVFESVPVGQEDFSGEFFRDNLGSLLGLELPISSNDVCAKLDIL